MTFPGTRSQLLSRGSWAAAASALALATLACSSQSAATAPSPTPSAVTSPSPSPSPSPAGDEVPVPDQVLPPATDLPAAKLCSKPVVTSADGNASPLFCSDGAVNVNAWSFYAQISQSVLGLGLNPNEGQPQSAMCDDIAHNGATKSTEVNGYRLAKAYYGWSFTFDPSKVTCP